MNKTLCLFAILSMATVLPGCDAQTDQPDAGPDATMPGPDAGSCSSCLPTAEPAKTVINSVQYHNWGKYEAGEICVTSNLDDANIEHSYIIRDQDRIDTLTPTSNGCFNLPMFDFELIPKPVDSYQGTPPSTGLLQLENGLKHNIRIDYNSGPEVDATPHRCAPTISNDTKTFPMGRLCVDSDLAGAPIEILDRLAILTIRSETNKCFDVPPNGYTIHYLKAKESDKVPLPVTIQVKDGEQQNAPKALYL